VTVEIKGCQETNVFSSVLSGRLPNTDWLPVVREMKARDLGATAIAKALGIGH